MNFAVVVAILLLATPLDVTAQRPGKMARVGVLFIATREQTAHFINAFEDGMRALGYVEGRSVVYLHRFANGNAERLPELAAEMVRLKLDVIVTGSNQQTAVAKRATKTIPIVMMLATQPVDTGLVASLSRPGGNLTGLSSDVGPDIIGKRLELFKEAILRLRRVAVLRDPRLPLSDTYPRAEDEAARKLGVVIERIDVRSSGELDTAFVAIKGMHVDGLVLQAAPLFFANRAQLMALVAQSGLPTISSARELIDASGLMSYGSSLPDLCRRAAGYVDKILKGANPGDLPVEQPTKFELVINLKTAKALGLTIPPSLLLRADQVIE